MIRSNFKVKSFILTIIGLSLTITSVRPVDSSSPDKPRLTFDLFRVVENVSKEKSAELRTVEINRRGGSFVIFTEPKPSFSIPVGEVNSITIEREHTRGTKNEYVFKATFSISKLEKMRFDAFASVNDGKRFDFRFGSNRLGTVQFVGRFEGGTDVTTFLESTDSRLLNKMFDPIKSKVIWNNE